MKLNRKTLLMSAFVLLIIVPSGIAVSLIKLGETNILTCPSDYKSCTVKYFVNGVQVSTRTISPGQSFKAELWGIPRPTTTTTTVRPTTIPTTTTTTVPTSTTIPSGGQWYQENANSYSLSGWNTFDQGLTTYDGKWNTWSGAFVSGGRGNAHLYANYIKPTAALPTSVWVVQDIVKRNLAIPTNCWNQNPLQLRAESFYGRYGADQLVYWSCYDGSTWTNLYVATGTIRVTEEAMLWNTS